jgi:hypothetical protein
VKRKDGGRWFLDGRDGLLRLEPNGSCDGAERFCGGRFAALGTGQLFTVLPIN